MFLRVSLVGIELLTVDARIVIASVDTYLRFAEAVNRLDLMQGGPVGIQELGKGRSNDNGSDNGDGNGKMKGAAEGVKQAVSRGDGKRD